jgi:hypothetical protein
VNALIGEQTSQRVDIVYKAKKKATQEQSEALTAVAMAVQDDNHYEWVESQVFSDGIIQDRGFMDIRMDFSKDMQGEIRITSEDPVNIMLDPSAKEYDPKSWNEVIKTKWMTLDEIEVQYGDGKRKELEAFVTNANTFGSDSVQYEEDNFGNDQGWYDDFAEITDKHIKRVRVIERQYRKKGMQWYFVDNETGDMAEVPQKTEEDRMRQIASELNLSLVKKKAMKIKWCVSCDGVTLHDDWSIYKNFTIVPYFPYFRRGKPFGVVRNLLSPQEQLNKIESQELHIVNTTSNSGYTVEAGSLVNMTTDELEERGAETGLVLVHAKGSEPPQKIKPNPVPTGIDRMSQKTAASIREISGVREEMLGQTNAEVSGVQMKAAQARGLVQMQVPFDNLARTRYILAERMMELIQDFYTETRVFRMTDQRDPQMRQKEVVINEPQADGTVLNDITLGEYGISISTAPARDSLEETQFAEAISLREAGVAIPDDVVIENSHLQRKNEIAQRVREMQGMGDPTPEQLEMQKMQQEMLIQRAQLELAELDAKVAKLQSEAQLTGAKAQTEGLQPTAMESDHQLEIAKLQAQLQMKVADIKKDLQLAGIHTQANSAQTMHSNLTKRTIEELKNRTQIEVAGLNQLNKPEKSDAPRARSK